MMGLLMHYDPEEWGDEPEPVESWRFLIVSWVLGVIAIGVALCALFL